MLLSHYKNRAVKIPCVTFEDFLELEKKGILKEALQKQTLKQIDTSNRDLESISQQTIDVNLGEDSLRINSHNYVIAHGEPGYETNTGLFLVMEKWEFPWFKKPWENLVYLPNEKNPIGTKLVILYDLENKSVSKHGFHSWPKPESRYGLFRRGQQSRGCMTMPDYQMQKLFEEVELGAIVKIKR